MAKTYVPERQSEYWTSRQIEDFFENCGVDVHTIPIPQHIEKKLPADFVFIPEHKIKLFGLQYKALYQDPYGDFWKLESHQHSTLQSFSWIYYGLSELKSRAHKRNSLHLLKIYVPSQFSFPTSGKFKQAAPPVKTYYRWGGFYKMLEDCQCGLKINSLDDLKKALSGTYQDIASDISLFLHNFDTGVTISVNRLLRPDEQYQDNDNID